ncbi:MAG TPA: ferritin-like domain-containing protein [Casimicrobiaceae bacterium]|nr:ferritin-like domain-containing protein [Casimicrobiaceae bacterium]
MPVEATPAPYGAGLVCAEPDRHWELRDIDLERVDRTVIASDWFAFKLVATASFIETGSDLYAANLRAFFCGDEPVVRWLRRSWEPEELRHGAALRAYVERVWPAFDWEGRFHSFLEEYSRSCTVAELEATRAQELAARCIVEMGTSALYRSLHGYAREPVLNSLAALVYADEVRHYKMFFRHFARYERSEGRSRLRVARTLVNRLLATRGEDGRCAYRQVWDFAPNPERLPFAASYAAFAADVTQMLRRHAPAEMLTRMILKPLSLPASIVDMATRLSGPLYAVWLSAARSGAR